MWHYHTTFLYCYILNSSRLIEIHGLILAGSQKLSPRCDCQTSAMSSHRWDMLLAILSLWEGFLSPLNKDLCIKNFHSVKMQNFWHLPIPQTWHFGKNRILLAALTSKNGHFRAKKERKRDHICYTLVNSNTLAKTEFWNFEGKESHFLGALTAKNGPFRPF